MAKPRPTCWDCGGTGIRVSWPIINGKRTKLEVSCGSCGGTGHK